MKKIKMSLIAVAIIISVGASYAFSPRAHGFTTYYAVKTGPTTWTWQTSTSGLSCTTDLNISCTGYVGSQPADNTVPSGFTTDGHVFF
jgi:hypothetical protein